MNKIHSTNSISWLSQLWEGILADFVSDPITGSASNILCNEALVRAKTPIIRRFSTKLSKVYPRMVCFDFQPCLIRSLEQGDSWSDKIWDRGWRDTGFSELCHLFDQFENCYGFRKQLDKAKEWQSLLWTLRRRDLWSTMLKTRLWEQHFFSLFQAFW